MADRKKAHSFIQRIPFDTQMLTEIGVPPDAQNSEMITVVKDIMFALCVDDASFVKQGAQRITTILYESDPLEYTDATDPRLKKLKSDIAKSAAVYLHQLMKKTGISFESDGLQFVIPSKYQKLRQGMIAEGKRGNPKSQPKEKLAAYRMAKTILTAMKQNGECGPTVSIDDILAEAGVMLDAGLIEAERAALATNIGKYQKSMAAVQAYHNKGKTELADRLVNEVLKQMKSQKECAPSTRSIDIMKAANIRIRPQSPKIDSAGLAATPFPDTDTSADKPIDAKLVGKTDFDNFAEIHHIPASEVQAVVAIAKAAIKGADSSAVRSNASKLFKRLPAKAKGVFKNDKHLGGAVIEFMKMTRAGTKKLIKPIAWNRLSTDNVEF